MSIRSYWKYFLRSLLVVGMGLGLTASWAAMMPSSSKTITLPAETAAFTPGPNVDLVTTVCTECHSADYATTQAYQTRAGWQAVINKMKVNFNMMPISTSDEALILDYLTTYYGTK